eukprot:gnl/MRDRNA2_/MRDRNA2_26171_c0_seq2.p1 gnl/MRDRNA2_/MRDRNA2_26171_c0~~gnl/MRDRNA2_/MRDRNA2_26171_c0_seq2.p1  ORF type:complete len:494 (-),score=88.03 gnl/MRDRNA2_/MRDRNA2_26171_c0_seq2:377-1858(-)
MGKKERKGFEAKLRRYGILIAVVILGATSWYLTFGAARSFQAKESSRWPNSTPDPDPDPLELMLPPQCREHVRKVRRPPTSSVPWVLRDHTRNNNICGLSSEATSCFKRVRPQLECGKCNSTRGRCFFGRCFCHVGFSGNDCGMVWNFTAAPCANFTNWRAKVVSCIENGLNDNTSDPCGPKLLAWYDSQGDKCFQHPDYGVAEVTQERWELAQWAESQAWKGNTDRCDRCEEHNGFFRDYQSVPFPLGDVAEVGCGPWTQTRQLLKLRSDLKPSVRSISLFDPGVEEYVKLASSTYKNGKVSKLNVTALPCGAEELPNAEAFDTLLMINVIEHCKDAFSVLQAVYLALKPGGVFIFHERFIPLRRKSEIYHPIRLTEDFYNHFLTVGFDVIFLAMPRNQWFQLLYFIGRKKAVPEMPVTMSTLEEKAKAFERDFELRSLLLEKSSASTAGRDDATKSKAAKPEAAKTTKSRKDGKIRKNEAGKQVKQAKTNR